MAWNRISTNGQVQYNVDEFVIDSPDDLKTLPKNALRVLQHYVQKMVLFM